MESGELHIHGEIEQFLTLFGSLREKCRGVPTRLGWLAAESATTARLLSDVYDAAQTLDLSLKRHSKYLVAPPRDFLGALKEWRDRWESLVSRLTAPARERRAAEIVGLIRDAAKGGGHSNQLFDEYYEKANPYHPFDPSRDNAVANIESALETALDFAGASSEVILDDDNSLFQKCEKGWGAWIYLANVVGIDFDKVIKRWVALDMVVIPKHVSDAHGLTEPGSMFDLLRQAQIAFMVGANMAALALCRALMELVLLRNYGCEPGRLKDVVAIAGQKYPHVRPLRLDQLRAQANEVLHAKTGKFSLGDDDILRFLCDLKVLIERAPTPNSSTR